MLKSERRRRSRRHRAMAEQPSDQFVSRTSAAAYRIGASFQCAALATDDFDVHLKFNDVARFLTERPVDEVWVGSSLPLFCCFPYARRERRCHRVEVLGAMVSRRPVRRRAPRAPAAVVLSVVLPEAAAAAVAEELPVSPPALPELPLLVSALLVGRPAVEPAVVQPAAVPQLLRPVQGGPTRDLVGVEDGAIGVAAIQLSSKACGSQRVL
ncbi:PREDICTED: uncharacterized protein LOC105150141 isoform X2 [Acromyrmex echinatior]|uniref:uncharacterized protein LOC105150141 isoform X2 n=1 Tax=Acromyrmex echinatior TaxID=103372 RepID=UPI000580F0FE|nr:PREDICTED: uncharacterized protein LOC105150141 isoform X2 [Acromyrmex echinatior]